MRNYSLKSLNFMGGGGLLKDSATDLMLVQEEGPEAGASYPVEQTRINLGREMDNTIVVDDPRVSRYHAELGISPTGTVILRDLGSTNGTSVRGEDLRTSQRLRPGDTFTLADSVRFRLIKRGELVSPPPQPFTAPESEEAPAQAEASEISAAGPMPGWFYVVMGTLTLLICLCLALAIYLWFAPLNFWEWISGLLGLPLP
ncbi:MAG: FHA domain-containing protein [Anaerolineae bacterium]